MTKFEEIRNALKDAMKAKDAVGLRTVRSMLTAFTNELVATGRTPQDVLDDASIMVVIKRLAKQRKDSIAQYDAAGRDDLSAPEKEELVVLEAYLPQLMSQDEIRPIATAKLAELGITEKAKLGIAIGAVKKELGEAADGSDVKAVVESLLA